MTIRFVLDATAVLAYSKGSIHVGEPLAELYDEADARFSVPVICLAEAGVTTDENSQMLVLAHHDRAVIAPVTADRWLDLVNVTKMLGSVQFAVPFPDMIQRDDCYLLTATPHRYPDTDMVIDIGN